MNSDWKQLLDAYPPEKKSWDRTYPWIGYVMRPLSFPTSWLLHQVGITANQVTIFTGLLGLLSIFFFLQGDPSALLGGTFCLLAYNYFDCVDGNLGRAWPRPGPPLGKFLDQVVGNFYWLSYLFMGIGLHTREALLWGSLAAVLKYAGQHTRLLFWNVLGPHWERGKAQASSTFHPHTSRFYYKIYYNLTDLQAHVFLLPLLVIVDALEIFLFFNFWVALLEIIVTLVLYIKRGYSLKGDPPTSP